MENGCVDRAPSPISSSAAECDSRAIWPTSPSFANATSKIAKRLRELCGSTSPKTDDFRGVTYLDVDGLSAVDRQFLVERQLISRELSESEGARGVAIDANEKYSLMINEEDHLRIQVMNSGLDLKSAWDQVNRIDDLIEQKLTYAFHDRLGYLTACPTNVGTGMRVSVMLHLPALVITQQIEKVFRSLQKISLAVRGLYGEGSQAMGDFYQISNQITLGRGEEELIEQVSDVVPAMIDYERRARQFLVKQSQKDLHDRVSRAYGILCTAQMISSGRNDDAPVERPDGRQSGTHRRRGNPHHQPALHSHTAGTFAKATRRGTRYGGPQY